MWSIQHIYMVPLFASMFVSLRAFRQHWPAPYKIFSILLISIFIVELLAIGWAYNLIRPARWSHNPSNLWLYNSFLAPQYLIYMAVYYQVITSKRVKTLILFLGPVYTAFALVNQLFIQGTNNVDSFTLTFAGGIVIFLTFVYFSQLLRGQENVNLAKQPMVWISVGAFIFHAAAPPYILSLNYLNGFNLSLSLALFYIFLGLNCLMYSLYTIAFLCPPPPRS